jgi:hypothetical protein
MIGKLRRPRGHYPKIGDFHDEVMAADVSQFRQQEKAEDARVLHGVCQDLGDIRAGRGRPAEELFAGIRHEFNLCPGA